MSLVTSEHMVNLSLRIFSCILLTGVAGVACSDSNGADGGADTGNGETTSEPTTTDPTVSPTTTPESDTDGPDPDSGTTVAPTDTTGGETTGGETTDDTHGEDIEACADEDLGSTVPQTVQGNNDGASDDFMPSCGARGGPDRLYAFTAPEDARYFFNTAGSSFDTTVSIVTDCGGTEVACNDVGANNSGSQLSIDLEAGQTIGIVIDSYDGEVGAFELNIGYAADGLICEFWGDALELCDQEGPGAMPHTGTLPCDANDDDLTYDVFEVDVQAGDCVHVFADNIGAEGQTGNEAGDLVLVVRDPDLDWWEFDDEVDCSDPAFGGFGCPAGGVVAGAAGTMRIGVAQWGGEGCPNPSPYTLRVSRNGDDVDLSSGPVGQDVCSI